MPDTRSLYTFRADDEPLLEGRYRRARLQRQEVAAPHPARYPVLVGPHGEGFQHPVVVSPPLAAAERDPVAGRELVQAVEDEVASGARPSEAVAREVDVPLWGVGPGQGGVR